MNPLKFIPPLVLAFWSFIEIFMLCNFGEMVMNSFNEINDAISTCDWYLFSMEIQRMLPLILMNSQHSIQFRGFGNIEISRNSFKSVSFFLNFNQKKVHYLCTCHEDKHKFYFFISKFSTYRLPMVDFHTSWYCGNSKIESTTLILYSYELKILL